MTGLVGAMAVSSFGPIAGIVALGMVFGAVDVLRLPNWAWRAAGEPKIVGLLLVVLLPGVGLAIYVFGARPRVAEIAANGRAASLPFERFGDRAESAVQSSRAIQALALPTTRGSFGEPITRPIRTKVTPGDATSQTPERTSFFDDPDVVTVGTADELRTTGETAQGQVATETVTVPAPESTLRIPSQSGKPYNPRQRASIDEGPLRDSSLAGVAAEWAGGSAPGTSTGGAAPQRFPRTVGTGAMSADLAPTSPTAAEAVDHPPRSTMAARWMDDPIGRHQYRYWDGGQWTENVYDAGIESRDPVTG